MYSAMDDPMVLESRLPYPKTLDKTVLVARATEIQEVLLAENGVHGHAVDVASGCMDDSEGGGTEDALFDTNHSTILDATSKHGDSAQDHGPSALTEPDGEGSLVDEQQREGSDSGCLLGCAAATGQGAEGRAMGEKARKRRSKNWTDEETENLLKAVRQKRNIRNRLDKSSSDSKPWWETVAKGMPGRSGYECRMRMDTLTKACKAIKEYCDEQNEEFRQLNKKDYEVMKRAHRKVATRFEESWYNQFRELFPLRSNKKRKEQGAGSPSENPPQSKTPQRGASASGTHASTRASVRSPGAVGDNSDGGSRSAVARSGGSDDKSNPTLYPLSDPLALAGPHRSTDGEHVGTPNPASPVPDAPSHTSPAHLPNHSGGQRGLPFLADPPVHPIGDLNHVGPSIKTAADSDEPYRTSAGDLVNNWAAPVNTLNVPCTDVDHLSGFSADDDELPQDPSEQGLRDTEHGSNEHVTDFEDTAWFAFLGFCSSDLFLASDAGDLDCF